MLHWQVPAQVEMQGRMAAVLRGVVAPEHDRDLAERVVRREATVEQAQNQIEVAGLAIPRKESPEEHTQAADYFAAGCSAKSLESGSPAQSPVDNFPQLAKPAAK